MFKESSEQQTRYICISDGLEAPPNRVTFPEVKCVLVCFRTAQNSDVQIPDFKWIQHIFEGSLEVKLPTIWTDEKQSREEAERRERLEEIRVEEKE